MSKQRNKYLKKKLDGLREELKLARAVQSTFQEQLSKSTKVVQKIVADIMDIEKEIRDNHV